VSQDGLDHVVFIFRKDGRWGSVGRSRDVGLHGRRPVFRNPRHLAWSYHDPYVDTTARLNAYGVANLQDLGAYDWRFSPRHLWKVSRHLYAMPHRPLVSSEKRYRQLVARFQEFRRRQPEGAPTYFPDRHLWML
ncbi:MAG TPA: hypothetical protein VNA19_02875, partial [Pyrinomonadaceae bacterium]|nr:hypothetical protein [Pyrinomonadaceae bacterium]